MLVECYDEAGAEVYEIIIKQIFQDLVLGSAVDDLKAFVNPDEPVFILAIKMRKTSNAIKFGEVANFTYDKADDVTRILIDNENLKMLVGNKMMAVECRTIFPLFLLRSGFPFRCFREFPWHSARLFQPCQTSMFRPWRQKRRSDF